MSTATASTPVKSHGKLHTTRAAGARMPLTPSPRTRQAGNRNHNPAPDRKGKSRQLINSVTVSAALDDPFNAPAPRRGRQGGAAVVASASTTSYGGDLTAHFAALNISPNSRRAVSAPGRKPAAKKPAVPPIRIDVNVTDWSLPGTTAKSPKADTTDKSQAKARNQARKIPVRKTKTTVRINGDRFIPVRQGTSPSTNSKLDFSALAMGKPRRADSGEGGSGGAGSRPGSSHSQYSGMSVLSGGAFGTDALTNPADDNNEDDNVVYPPPDPQNLAYQSSVAAACGVNLDTRILSFKPNAPESNKPADLRSQYNKPVKSNNSATTRRRILTAPERVLDAPGLVDDYYLNLLDWSSTNQVAIGLEQSVYIWNADSGSVNCLLELNDDDYIASVKWSQDGAYVAVGCGTGHVQIWDVEESTKLRTMIGHTSRVGATSWNRALLSTGSRSGLIFNHDVRIAHHRVAVLESHTSEVCGLEWRSDGAQLASGGNDNLVNIWDARALAAPKWSKANHRAAVKALAWCPWQLNLLATGGGAYDRHIHFWNSTTGARVNSIDTGSQVTALRWSTHYKEIVSCHGFPDNQLSVWSYPTLVRNIEIPAHETRVLHAALSPDGQTLATAASDESLKFWKLFEKPEKPKVTSGSGVRANGKPSMAKQMTIR